MYEILLVNERDEPMMIREMYWSDHEAIVDAKSRETFFDLELVYIKRNGVRIDV